MNLGMRISLVMHTKNLYNAFLQIFPPNFKHCTRAEICQGIATKFKPGGRSEISARAEIRHVIGPLTWEI